MVIEKVREKSQTLYKVYQAKVLVKWKALLNSTEEIILQQLNEKRMHWEGQISEKVAVLKKLSEYCKLKMWVSICHGEGEKQGKWLC